MIEEKTENTQAVNRVVQVPVALLPAGAAGKTMMDSSDLTKTTSLARIVPRAVHEENQVQERAARRKIMGTIMIALPVAAAHVLESEAAVEDDNRTIFKENEH